MIKRSFKIRYNIGETPVMYSELDDGRYMMSGHMPSNCWIDDFNSREIDKQEFASALLHYITHKTALYDSLRSSDI